MKHNDFIDSVNHTLGHCCDLLLIKSEEYTPDEDDRLAAFKQAAALERTTPERALFGMLAKHLISVQNMCDTKIRDYTKERWQEKITDSINYLLLLKGLVDEEFEADEYKEAKHEKH